MCDAGAAGAAAAAAWSNASEMNRPFGIYYAQ